MSKNTVDGNCMTKKMLIVVLSTDSVTEKKNTNELKKKVNKKNFVYVFDRVRTCDLMIFI